VTFSEMRFYAVNRPYILSHQDGRAYVLTSEEAQRLLDAYSATVRKGTAYLKDEEGKIVATLSPATPGGGPAFRVYRAC